MNTLGQKESNEMLIGEITKFEEELGGRINSVFEELANTKNAIGTALKLILGKSKHVEYFYKDFKDKYDKIQPLAEKLHDRMSGFKYEREAMEKVIAESSGSDDEKNEFQKIVKDAYNLSEKYLIPIPYKLEKMEGNMRNIKAADKKSNFKSRTDNRRDFYGAYNDIRTAMVIYKSMMNVIENIKKSMLQDKMIQMILQSLI